MKKKNTDAQAAPSLPEHFLVLGADLSLNRPGFAVIEYNKGKVDLIRMSCVDNKSKPNKKPRGHTLTEIADHFTVLMEDLNKTDLPLYLVRERAINNASFGKRSGTAARTGVSEVVGVVDYMAWIYQKQWEELFPISIKKLITGNGKADKTAVAVALKNYIGEHEYQFDDMSDAAAVAVAWLISKGELETIEN